jgi:hypothetical protein
MPDLMTAVRLAAQDKEFAKDFIANPEKYKGTFGLTEKQVEAVKEAAKSVDARGKLGNVDYIG